MYFIFVCKERMFVLQVIVIHVTIVLQNCGRRSLYTQSSNGLLQGNFLCVGAKNRQMMFACKINLFNFSAQICQSDAAGRFSVIFMRAD